jgi:UDP-N-acetyl-D-glucosamine dehydrogenase
MHYALAGCKVIIYDPDSNTVNSINSGVPRSGEYLGYINENIKKLVSVGGICATTDFNSIKDKLIHLLDVPTEKANAPYLAIVKDSIQTLESCIPSEGIIIVESTLQPGTLDSLYLPRVYNHEISLAVAFRMDWFADCEKNVTNLPRWVGGMNAVSTKKASEIVSIICEDVRETNYREAEAGKALQNALYFLQIEGAYQFAETYHKLIDVNEVLKIVGSHWRLPNLYLGAGTSGRCVSMGAKYIVEGAKSSNNDYGITLPLFEQALRYDYNWREKIGDFITKRFDFAQSEKVKILVMGIAYSPNFSDFGNSAGLQIAEYLHRAAWNVYIHDPIVSKYSLQKISKVPFFEGQDVDVILLTTAHDIYKTYDILNYLRKDNNQLVVDCTGAWDQEPYKENFKKNGINYIRVGEQGWLDK